MRRGSIIGAKQHFNNNYNFKELKAKETIPIRQEEGHDIYNSFRNCLNKSAS